MLSDSNDRAVVSKDLPKKKRKNRLAKLKQSKRDVRRDQWLSQLKNKGCKMDLFERGKSPPPSTQTSLEMRSRDGDNEDSSIHQSDSESLMSRSTLDSSDSANFNGRNSLSSCCSRSISEEEEEDNGCVDDWESIADALITKDNQHKPFVSEDSEQPYKNPSGQNLSAWRLDDALRPTILPNPSKQQDFPMNSEQHCGNDAIELAWKSFMAQPCPCPICYEDLDVTDSSFLPCSCGFRLCLFCHKTILEVDRRCPGCRKKYDCTNGGMSINVRLAI
ncbi:hypothetical protein UlMin_014897 [Ulmus minor]